MWIDTYRDGFNYFVRSRVDDLHRAVALITDERETSVAGKRHAGWAFAHGDRAENTKVLNIDDGDIIFADVGHPDVAIIVRDRDHMTAAAGENRCHGFQAL